MTDLKPFHAAVRDAMLLIPEVVGTLSTAIDPETGDLLVTSYRRLRMHSVEHATHLSTMQGPEADALRARVEASVEQLRSDLDLTEPSGWVLTPVPSGPCSLCHCASPALDELRTCEECGVRRCTNEGCDSPVRHEPR